MTPMHCRDSTADEAEARRLLAELYTPEGVEIWLGRRKHSMLGARPIDLIQQGNGDKVIAHLHMLLDGAFL